VVTLTVPQSSFTSLVCKWRDFAKQNVTAQIAGCFPTFKTDYTVYVCISQTDMLFLCLQIYYISITYVQWYTGKVLCKFGIFGKQFQLLPQHEFSHLQVSLYLPLHQQKVEFSSSKSNSACIESVMSNPQSACHQAATYAEIHNAQ